VSKLLPYQRKVRLCAGSARLKKGWLILKLGAVVLMVAAHGCFGWLILRLEMGIFKGVKAASLCALLLALVGIFGVLGFVLSKPLEWS